MLQYQQLSASAVATEDSSREEVLASRIYAKFAKDEVSKPVAAQYLAERLERKWKSGELTAASLGGRLPRYITNAIDYVTGAAPAAVLPAEVANE